MQSSFFVSNRNQTVRSTLGHSITFAKGKATHVPRALHHLVVEKGIMPCDAEGKLFPEQGEEIVAEATPASPSVSPQDPELRTEKLLEAFKAIIERNDSKEFTGGGTPNAEAVSMRLGWKVDPKEVRQAWVKHRQSLLGKDD